MILATTALIMPITPAAVTVGTPHWTVEVKHPTWQCDKPYIQFGSVASDMKTGWGNQSLERI